MQANELERELNRTKIALMQSKEAVFFTTIVFSLKFVWDENHPTAYTNGYKIGFNPDFFMGMSREERAGVLIHEAYHVAADHLGRLGKRDPRIWNAAADHVINLDLKSRNIKLPVPHLADSRFVGMSTEQVYQILDSEAIEIELPMEDIMGGNGEGQGEDGEGNPVTAEQRQRHVEALLVRASVQAKMQGAKPGSIPGEVELMLNRLMKPRLPWQTILRREVTDLAKVGYTWQRPNRRYTPDHYLPSLNVPAVTDLTFYVDISGSVSDDQFRIFVSEIASTFKMFPMKNLRIVQFDTKIRNDDTVKNIQELMKIKFTGRGGTCPECIFEDMDKTKPRLALVFTDGEFHWHRDKVKPRLLWLINDNERFKPRFGRAIHFTTYEKN